MCKNLGDFSHVSLIIETLKRIEQKTGYPMPVILLLGCAIARVLAFVRDCGKIVTDLMSFFICESKTFRSMESGNRGDALQAVFFWSVLGSACILESWFMLIMDSFPVYFAMKTALLLGFMCSFQE